MLKLSSVVSDDFNVSSIKTTIFIAHTESWSSITDPTGAFLIDRSPVYFEPIINYLRHGQLILDNGVNPQGNKLQNCTVQTN